MLETDAGRISVLFAPFIRSVFFPPSLCRVLGFCCALPPASVRPPPPHHPQLFHTQLFHTQLFHTVFFTRLCHTQLFTRNFAHNSLTQLCHTQLFAHNFQLCLTHNSSHGKRCTWWHPRSLCVAGVALTALGWLGWRGCFWRATTFKLETWWWARIEHGLFPFAF